MYLKVKFTPTQHELLEYVFIVFIGINQMLNHRFKLEKGFDC